MQKPNSGRTHARSGKEKRSTSATKAGPGRYHQGGKPGNRLTKPHALRAYVALMAAWASRRVVQIPEYSDSHGAFTVVGNPHRKWLAGISAQRGF